MPAAGDTAPCRPADRAVFALLLVLGGSGLAAAALAVAEAFASVHRDGAAAHDVAIAGQHFTYPAVNVAAGLLLTLAAVGAAILAIAARTGVRHLRDHRRFLRAIPALGPLPGHPGVTVIDDPGPHAFCAGYVRPRIYVSTGALARLEHDELAAVLLHEDHHRALRDPLRLACARVLGQALFFLPALCALGERYGELAEERADGAAVRALGREGPLAAALLAFDAGAPAGTSGISPARVDSLLGRPAEWRLPAGVLAVSLATVAVLVVLVWRASGVASASATFDLPVLSSQPCMLVLALVPVVGTAAARVSAGRRAGRRRLRSAQR